MRQLVILLFALLIIGCKKDDPTPSDNSAYHMRVVDITPETYQFINGKWHFCDYDNRNFVFSNDTFYTPWGGTCKYELIRVYNINEIMYWNLIDSTTVAYQPIEFKENGEFWIGPYKCCR